MKIVVLAGGISTERTVSLVSGTGVCQALRRKGHQAILVDLFMGLENPPADLNALRPFWWICLWDWKIRPQI